MAIGSDNCGDIDSNKTNDGDSDIDKCNGSDFIIWLW